MNINKKRIIYTIPALAISISLILVSCTNNISNKNDKLATNIPTSSTTSIPTTNPTSSAISVATASPTSSAISVATASPITVATNSPTPVSESATPKPSQQSEVAPTPTTSATSTSLPSATPLPTDTTMPAGVIFPDNRSLPTLSKPISDTNPNLLHTVITISLYDKGDELLIKDCFKIIGGYENLISRTDEKKATSEIYKLNHAGGKPVMLSDDVLTCLKKGVEYSKASEGVFDVTIGGITSLWNFQSGTRKPKDALIQSALPTVDYNNVVINGNSVYLKNPKTAIDLGGIAKGYIADKVAEYLTIQGVHGAIINLGGNVYALGKKPNGNGFNIGIRSPETDSTNVVGTINVSNKSVVSSGAYEQYFVDVDDGKTYFHILDTKTGYPIESDLSQATIISDSSTDGDGLSTTVFSLGSVKGLAHIEKLPGIECILIKKDGTVITSSGIGAGKSLEYKPYKN